ncbi:hypothetical protein Tco_1245992 [Tanacetum coccineum]
MVIEKVGALHISLSFEETDQFVEEWSRSGSKSQTVEASHVPIFKVRWTLREVTELTLGNVKIIFQEENTASFHEDRTVDKYRIVSLEDKAHLTGEDYNTPCFRKSFECKDSNALQEIRAYNLPEKNMLKSVNIKVGEFIEGQSSSTSQHKLKRAHQRVEQSEERSQLSLQDVRASREAAVSRDSRKQKSEAKQE